MAPNSIFKNLISDLPPSILNEFMGCFETVEVKKGETLLNIGEVSHHMFVVVSGAVRYCRFTADGAEVNTWFAFENEAIAVISSYAREKPSKVALIAIENCILKKIERKDIENLRQKYHSFETFSRKLLEEYFITAEQRAFIVQSLSAKDKYKQLLEMKPQVLDRVPQNQLASYLGIKNETFSRIKKKIEANS